MDQSVILIKADDSRDTLALMLLGLILLTLGAMALIPLESWVHRNLKGLTDSLAEHIYLPAARTLLVIGFLYCVYPQPMLNDAALHAANRAILKGPDWHSLLNILFIAGALLPLLPKAERVGALILPLQTLIGGWIFIDHFEASAQVALRLSNPGILLWMTVIVFASHYVLRYIAETAGSAYQRDPLSLYDAMALIVQPPLVLVITRAYIPI